VGEGGEAWGIEFYHARKQVQSAKADSDIGVIQALDYEVPVFSNSLGVHLHDVVQRQQAQVLHCIKPKEKGK